MSVARERFISDPSRQQHTEDNWGAEDSGNGEHDRTHALVHGQQSFRILLTPFLSLALYNSHQVQAVCIGIEHLVKVHKRRTNGRGGGEPAVVCQLCESTRRVLRAAREHAKLVGHDRKNCDACRMWAMVRARYTYRQRVNAANARSAALNAAFESSRVAEGSGKFADPPSTATQEVKEGHPMRVLEKKKRSVRFCNEVDYGLEEKRVRMVHTEGG